jgi:hypothetical protein
MKRRAIALAFGQVIHTSLLRGLVWGFQFSEGYGRGALNRANRLPSAKPIASMYGPVSNGSGATLQFKSWLEAE